MESSTNQIIINTKDSNGVIRNINYTPDRNITIVNSLNSSGSNAYFTDAVTLDFLNKTVNATLSNYGSCTLNSQYGVINFTLGGSISGNSVTMYTFYNSFITGGSIVHLKIINTNYTPSNAYGFFTIVGMATGSCSLMFFTVPSFGSIYAGYTIKCFFYIY